MMNDLFGLSSQWACGCEQKHGTRTVSCANHPPNLKLTICIASNPHRAEQLKRLMAVLEPQLTPEVEVLIFFNNFEFSLGYLRQCLIEEAKGEYVCHIDDDDMVPDDYVATILPLLDGVDYIGFKVKFIDAGVVMPPVYHSLKYDHWHQDDNGYYRGITHLNPVKRTLAVAAGFPIERHVGEDEQWAAKVKAKTEHFIDKIMYEYHHQADESVAYANHSDEEVAKLQRPRNRLKPHDTPAPPKFKSKNIRLHPKSTKALR